MVGLRCKGPESNFSNINEKTLFAPNSASRLLLVGLLRKHVAEIQGIPRAPQESNPIFVT